METISDFYYLAHLSCSFCALCFAIFFFRKRLIPFFYRLWPFFKAIPVQDKDVYRGNLRSEAVSSPKIRWDSSTGRQKFIKVEMQFYANHRSITVHKICKFWRQQHPRSSLPVVDLIYILPNIRNLIWINLHRRKQNSWQQISTNIAPTTLSFPSL